MSALVRRLLWLVPLVMLIAGVLMLRREHEAERLTIDAQSPVANANVEDTFPTKRTQITQAGPTAAEAQPLPYPSSLAGTEIDGELHVDASGQFLPDPDVLRFFEYFLSALGELDEGALRLRIVAAMNERLPKSAQAQAAAFLDDYLSYRRESGDLGEVGDDPKALHAAIDKLYALRRESFGTKLADKLFGEEEAVRTHALERRLILADTSLSESERAQRLRELERDEPEGLRKAREQVALPLTTRDQVLAMRAQGANDDEVHAARVKALGPEAAVRLEKLDQTRADFDRRLSEFRAQRTAITQDAKQTAPARAAAIEAAFERTFAPEERTRAGVLTRN